METGKTYWLDMRTDELKFAKLMLETYQWSNIDIALEIYNNCMIMADVYLKKANEYKVILKS